MLEGCQFESLRLHYLVALRRNGQRQCLESPLCRGLPPKELTVETLFQASICLFLVTLTCADCRIAINGSGLPGPVPELGAPDAGIETRQDLATGFCAG